MISNREILSSFLLRFAIEIMETESGVLEAIVIFSFAFVTVSVYNGTLAKTRIEWINIKVDVRIVVNYHEHAFSAGYSQSSDS